MDLSELTPYAVETRYDAEFWPDVDALVHAALDAFPHLRILVNNAGVYGPLGLIEDVDWDAWVAARRCFSITHLAIQDLRAR